MLCPNCDRRIPDDAEVCESCGKPLPSEEDEFDENDVDLGEEPKPLRGFTGALLGALLSTVLIALLPQWGMQPSFGGVVVAFFVFMGYRLLSKTMTKIGVGVCLMFTLLTPYIADRIVWAVWVLENVTELAGFPLEGVSLMETFLLVPVALDEDKINVIEYFMGLLRLYLFTGVGGVAYLAGRMKGRRKKKQQEPRHL